MLKEETQCIKSQCASSLLMKNEARIWALPVCSVLWLTSNYRWENQGSEVHLFHSLQPASGRCGIKPDSRTAVLCSLLPPPLSRAACSQCPQMGVTLKEGTLWGPSLFTTCQTTAFRGGLGGTDHLREFLGRIIPYGVTPYGDYHCVKKNSQEEFQADASQTETK